MMREPELLTRNQYRIDVHERNVWHGTVVFSFRVNLNDNFLLRLDAQSFTALTEDLGMRPLDETATVYESQKL